MSVSHPIRENALKMLRIELRLIIVGETQYENTGSQRLAPDILQQKQFWRSFDDFAGS